MSDSYPYERLGAQQFQRLAQALVAAEYHGIQCLPLHGSDGGRDAIQVACDSDGATDAVIYQAKFKEPPPLGVPTAKDYYRWMTGQLTREIPNIELLAVGGANSYHVITNIPATAVPERGLRDKMQTWAKENLSLPTVFWWRDDLDARLLNRYDLIFHFSLFTTPESVRAVLEARFENRTDPTIAVQYSETPSTIRTLTAYLAELHDIESILRFEQADLDSSPLIDLFVDVPPILRSSHNATQDVLEWMRQVSSDHESEQASNSEDEHTSDSLNSQEPVSSTTTPSVGIASLLLSSVLPKFARRIVLEGTPGQGKSTSGQYVCQVHRIRMLGRDEELRKLPHEHAVSPVRLPIRIDFRHLASWFSKVDPWTSEPIDHTASTAFWAKSLESHIAAHIRTASGGMAFTPDDVVAIVSRTPTFLLLDGLDEVPDLELRRQLIVAVNATIRRLESLNADLQVLITTRPATFIKAEGFSRDTYKYLQLAPLERKLIDQYTASWIKIRNLDDIRSAEILATLDASLQQSHFAELARNPMQLAILLWFISSKARSLPHQRTALYEQYLHAFLDREAKTSIDVQNHHSLLLQIHGFLGWLLQARSESPGPGRTGGDITLEELREIVAAYLTATKRSTEILDQLFAGAERIFMLVSRIEGKYEFEIQPIQEFFAARYLYKTAAYSRAGLPAAGSRPDRLAQLLRNPYWLNVARFFSGWYDEGELADLSRHLKDLFSEDTYRLLSHSRVLIGSILRDYTTSESPRDTIELANEMSDTLGIRFITSDYGSASGIVPGEGPMLPPDSGLHVLEERVRSQFLDAKTDEAAWDLAFAIRRNEPGKERGDWWLKLENNPSLTRDTWLLRGVQTDAVANIPIENALRIFDPITGSRLDWIRCVEAGRFDVALHDPARLERFLGAIAGGHAPLSGTTRCDAAGSLSMLPIALGLQRFRKARSQMFLEPMTIEDVPCHCGSDVRNHAERLSRLLQTVSSLCSFKEPRDLARSMERTVEEIHGVLGETWLSWRIALIAGTVPWKVKASSNLSFTDSSVGIVSRCRRAKLAGNNVDFWCEAAETAANGHIPLMGTTAAMLAWAAPSVLTSTLPMIAPYLDNLERYELRFLYQCIEMLGSMSGAGRSAPVKLSNDGLDQLLDMSPSTLALLEARAGNETSSVFIKHLKARCEDDASFLTGRHGSLLSSLLLVDAVEKWKESRSPEHLDEVKRFYSTTVHGVLERPSAYGMFSLTGWSPSVWSDILSSPFDYPALLVHSADLAASHFLVKKLRPLREIARNEQWFPDLPSLCNACDWPGSSAPPFPTRSRLLSRCPEA